MLNILPSARRMIENNRSRDIELMQRPKAKKRFSGKHGGQNKKTEQKDNSVERYSVLKQLLRQYGLRPTKQRMVIAACLFKGETHHVSADILHKQITATGESMSVATIYNSLRHFVDAGLIHAVATCGARQWFCVSKILGTTTHTEDVYVDQGCNCQFYFDDNQHIEALEYKEFDPSLLPSAPEGYEISRIDVAIHLTKKATYLPPQPSSN